jgi:hypothetical protein
MCSNWAVGVLQSEMLILGKVGEGCNSLQFAVGCLSRAATACWYAAIAAGAVSTPRARQRIVGHGSNVTDGPVL